MMLTRVHGATVPFLAAVLVLAGCAAPPASPPQAAPCESVPSRTPTPKTPEAAEPEQRDIAAAPELATGYRGDMAAVRTGRFAVATANPLATQAACRVWPAAGQPQMPLSPAPDGARTRRTAVFGIKRWWSSPAVLRRALKGRVQAYDGQGGPSRGGRELPALGF